MSECQTRPYLSDLTHLFKPGESRGAKSFALDGCCHSARLQCSLFEYAMFRGKAHAIPASGGRLVPAGYPPHLATIEAESDIVAAAHHFRLTHQFVLFSNMPAPMSRAPEFFAGQSITSACTAPETKIIASNAAFIWKPPRRTGLRYLSRNRRFPRPYFCPVR